jgi:murein DD-endopeptidase MepM/ murein hydrolase activator NlpD
LAQNRQLPVIKFQLYPELNSFLVGLDQHKDIFTYKVKKNSSLYNELLQFGFNGKDISDIQKAAMPYFNFSKLLPNTPYRFLYDSIPIIQWSGVEFKLSPKSYLTLTKKVNASIRAPSGTIEFPPTINQESVASAAPSFSALTENFSTAELHNKADLNFNDRASEVSWQAQFSQLKIDTKIASFSGVVTSSLWKSAEQAQMDAKLISDLTEIFAWQIDFSRQVNEDDSWRLVVEQQIVNNQPVGWGKILAAEYNNGSTIYEAYYYEKNGFAGYFSKDGKSSTRTLLRTPIEFARITSGFSLRRFHPQLKIVRPHLGVDYAAPKGTPIRSVGDGKVTEARYTISGGKTLTVEHNSVYKTRYLHLNGFAGTVQAGSFVKQGQVIGYVGSTGFSTGPHLHFEFYEHNVYKDPLKVVLPPSQSIPSHLFADFRKIAGQWIAMLPSWPRQIASSK